MRPLFALPALASETLPHYCPGCTHGIINRLIDEAHSELGLDGRCLGLASVGCAVLADFYLHARVIGAPPGRAPSLAASAKRSSPESVIFTYQGSGDLTPSGLAELKEAAARGEKLTVIYVNNSLEADAAGEPGLCESLASLDAPAFIVRGAVHAPRFILRTKQALRRAFALQQAGRCFTFVEVLSICPANWGLTPAESLRRLEEKMLPRLPLGVFKDPDKGRGDYQQ